MEGEWTINNIHRNGDLTITGRNGKIRLPNHYAKQHAELGYVQTGHGTQGGTVDRGILLYDTPTDIRGLYVPLTRGRLSNDVFIPTPGEQTAPEIFTNAIGQNWIDQPAHTRQQQLNPTVPHRPGTLPQAELAQLLDQHAQLDITLTQLDHDRTQPPKDIRRLKHQKGELITELKQTRGQLQEAFDCLAQHDKPLRRRGHETDIAKAKKTIETLPAKMDTQTDKIAGIENQLTETYRRWNQADQLNHDEGPALRAQHTDTARRLNEDRVIRTNRTRHNPPERITNQLGHRPTSPKGAQLWDKAAGQLDQHQTAFNLTQGLGPEKATNLPSAFTHSRTATVSTQQELHKALNQQRQTLQRNTTALRIGR